MSKEDVRREGWSAGALGVDDATHKHGLEGLEVDGAAALREEPRHRAANHFPQLRIRGGHAERLEDVAELVLGDFTISVLVEQLEDLLRACLVQIGQHG